MRTICFFSGDITRAGGTERVATIIANALAARIDLRVLMLSLVEQNDALFFPLDDTITHSALGDHWIDPGLKYLPVIPKLRRFLKEQHVDILIDIDIVLDVLSVPATRFLPTKVIAWEHFNYQYEMTVGYRRMILRLFTRRADCIITLTRADQASFQRALHREKRIHAIYNPMEETAEPGTLEKENALITVGALLPVKGMDYLCEVARLLLPKHPDWKWYVIGEGTERERLLHAIAQYHLEKQLILTGKVKDVHPYLAKAKIYVMTSRREGLSMALLEAKSHALPSVSFDIATGPSEIIEQNVNGFLIPAYDCAKMAEKLTCLMTDDALLKDFASHAKDNARKFHIDSIIERWLALFKQLCDNGNA